MDIVQMVDLVLKYLPTAVVTLVLGVIAQRVVRAGKREEIEQQREANAAANRLSEADLVNKSLRTDLEREHSWRLVEESKRREAEDRADRLRDLVVGQVALEAHRTEIEPPRP